MRVSPYHDSKHVNGFTSAAISTNTTTLGAEIDLGQSPGGDWRSVLWLVTAATITDGTYVLGVQESDTTSTGFAAATGSQNVQGPSASITATGGTAEIAYTGNKRFVKLSITSTAVTTGGTMASRAVLHGTAAYRR